jgi:hypothetical protein
MLTVGHGIGLVSPTDRPLATCILLPYTVETDWIGMMLVDPELRGQGLGTRLMKLTVEVSLNPILGLDATEQGAQLYRRLGFEDAEGVTRYERAPADTQTDGSDDEVMSVRPTEFSEWSTHLAPESQHERLNLLQQIDSTGLGYRSLIREGRLAGLAIIRDGRKASQIGPLFANEVASALRLLSALVRSAPRPVIVDVPDRHAAFRKRITAMGFEPVRSFVRMFLGGLPHPNRFEYVIAGPEFG